MNAEAFWDLPPKERFAIADDAGLFDNDYEESLEIAVQSEIAADMEAVIIATRSLKWDDPFKTWDDANIDYHPYSPTHDAYGEPYLVMCADCFGSPVTHNEDGYAGLFCEVCERRRERRGLLI